MPALLGTPNATVGTSAPPSRELVALSAAITPRTSPLPKVRPRPSRSSARGHRRSRAIRTRSRARRENRIPFLGISYAHALKTEKGAAQTFGRGDVRGVIAAESANNSREGGALVPTVAFGVPGSAGMAILMGAFMIHGLVPGPDMLTKHLGVTYSMVWSVALANVLGSGLCYLFPRQFASSRRCVTR